MTSRPHLTAQPRCITASAWTSRLLSTAGGGRRLKSSRTGNGNDGDDLINEQLLRYDTVRLIATDGENLGTMSGADALSRARAAGLDLLRVSGSSTTPPVLRIVDYTALQDNRRKKAYEKNKADKQSRKLQRRELVLKQIRLSPTTDTNDIAIKLRRAREMLLDGYRVKVYMMFRRGHGMLVDSAKQSLIYAAEQLSKYGKVQGIGPGMTSVHDLLYPPKKKKRGIRNSGGAVAEYDEEEDEDVEEGKKKPLQILIAPLPRKERFQVLEKLEKGGD